MKRKLAVIFGLTALAAVTALLTSVTQVAYRQPPQVAVKPSPSLTLTPPGSPVISVTASPSPATSNAPSPATPTPGRGGAPTPASSPAPTLNPTTPPVSAMEISRGNTGRRNIIFTFDCGAGTQSLPAILNTLAAYHVKGTFFMTGQWATANPAAASQIAAAGHEIFNHTYDHPYLTQLSDAQIIGELQQAENVISPLTGRTTRPYFRPPYGDRNTHVLQVAAAQGYQSVYWTVDALDWKEPDGYTAAQVQNRILSTLGNGNIYLMHVGDNITGQILSSVFSQLSSQGYSISSLTQGL